MIAVIVPTLNEEKAIGEVLEKFPAETHGHKVELYVIDGGSTDNTVSIAEEKGATVLRQHLTGGKGDAVREAIEEIDADIYVMIDGDGTYDPEELDKILEPIVNGEAGHVIGKRVKREQGAIPTLNLAGNKIFNLFATIFTGESVEDMLSGFRAFTCSSKAN